MQTTKHDVEVKLEVELALAARDIHKHRVALAALTTRRNVLIRELANRDYSERRIARLAGISAPVVHEVKHNGN